MQNSRDGLDAGGSGAGELTKSNNSRCALMLAAIYGVAILIAVAFSPNFDLFGFNESPKKNPTGANAAPVITAPASN